MKKIFFVFLMLPFASFCQCSTWIGQPVENSLQLLDSAKPVMQFQVAQTGDTSRKDKLIFSDEKGLFTFQIMLNEKDALSGTDVVTTYPTVNSIYITGPTERIEQFYASLKLIFL